MLLSSRGAQRRWIFLGWADFQASGGKSCGQKLALTATDDSQSMTTVYAIGHRREIYDILAVLISEFG